ncbi:MAG TPA: isoprenylcysteine carboxylmethyltransferase family protein [Terriglobales bacterium]|jgi:protein-S-isoprenylcysteine O-methyltransferase Ste14
MTDYNALQMLVFLQTAGWLACVIYSTIPAFWLMIHPYVAYWRSRSSSPYRVLLPLWIGMWFVIIGVTYSWRHVTVYSEPWCWIPAVALFTVGIWIYRQSGRAFTASCLGGVPELRRHLGEQQLITSGIRSRVRHPVYLAHFCEMLAWSIGTGLAICYALTLFAAVSGAFMLRQEDAELEQRFGDDFRRYKNKVPALLPHF